MGLPLRITYRNLDGSDAIEASIRKHAEKLLTFESRITGCDVAIEAPHRHKQHGRHYRVRVNVAVPGGVITAGRNPDVGREHEDLYAAIDGIFARVARQIRDHAAKRGDHHGVAREGTT